MPILCWPPKRTSVPSTVSKLGDVCLPTTHFIHCILRPPPGRRSGSRLGGEQQTLHSARSVCPRATGKPHKRRQQTNPKTPNRSRKIKTSATQGPKKRRRRNQPKGAGSQLRAYACLGLSVVALLWIRFGHRCDAWAEQLLHRLLVHGCSNLLLRSHKSRYRVQTKLPVPNGCDSENRPTVSEARPKGQYSRPGPKSGMGRMLLIMLLVIKCQLSHGVRVPTHSVGVGEGSPQVNTRSRCVSKINGIQVAYGKQDPTHEWNKYVKRSFKRACNRAVKHGQASYRGRMLTVKHAPEQQPSRPHRQHPSSKHPQRRLQVFCYNVGGLGSGMCEDLMGFLDQSHYDVALVQETKLRVDSEYVTSNWICVGSGTESQKQAGVMVMIRKAIANVREVRHDAVIPGRLLRVRFPLGNDSCKLSVICAYQHAWNPKDANIMVKREEFWCKMSQCVGSVPYREHLVLGGDLNVQLTPMYPHVGHGTGALSAERAPDTDAAHAIMSTHSLVALNTWGQQGCKAHTFVVGKHQAQLDYVIVRQRHSDGQARNARPVQNCPVGACRRCHFVAKSSINRRPRLQALMRKRLFSSLSRVVQRPVRSSRGSGVMSPKKLHRSRR